MSSKVTVYGVDTAHFLVKVMAKEAPAISHKLAYRVAASLAGRIRHKIVAQEEHWHPLNRDYLRGKIRKGLSSKILIARHRYADTIRPRLILMDNGEGGFEVGPSNGSIGDGSTSSFAELGVWLEFGTRNDDGSVRMPARPHFRPAWRELEEDMEMLVGRFSSDLNVYLRPKIDGVIAKTSSSHQVFNL